MSLYLDRKFLLLISARLRNFKQKKDDLFNFSCPVCGDSTYNERKARGYVSKSKNFNGYIYSCHNCSVSMGFSKFLQFIDSERYKEYMFEKFQDNDRKVHRPDELSHETIEAIKNSKMDSKHDHLNALMPIYIRDIKLESMNQLSDDHFAKQYILGRKIPEKFFDEIFFAPDFKKFVIDTFPESDSEHLIDDDPRIVMFHTSASGYITQVNGRALSNADHKLRYIKVRVAEGQKVFGLHRLDYTNPVLIVEGEFDSYFLPNCLASGDANLIGLADWIFDTFGISSTLIFDNEPRNKQIVYNMEKAINARWGIVIWSNAFEYKDINEAIMGGYTLKQIESIIDSNIYCDLSAKLRLSQWKKCEWFLV